MRRSLAVIIVIVLALLNTQCDPGTLSLFPGFLTSVTHTANAGTYFTHVSGEKFFIYTMRTDAPYNTDFIYVIQTTPTGNRRMAVYNGVLQLISTLTDPYVGRAHLRLEGNYQLIGKNIVNSSSADDILYTYSALFPGMLDRLMSIDDSNNAYEFWMDEGTADVNLYWNTCEYFPATHNFAAATNGNGPCTFTPGDRRYALEEVSRDLYATQLFLFVRDKGTNEGYLGQISMPLPTIAFGLTLMPLDSSYRFVPGTVQFVPGGSFVAQTYDGYLRRFWMSGGMEEKLSADNLNGFLIAYAENDIMYTFNPSTLTLFKSLAWWRDDYK